MKARSAVVLGNRQCTATILSKATIKLFSELVTSKELTPVSQIYFERSIYSDLIYHSFTDNVKLADLP